MTFLKVIGILFYFSDPVTFENHTIAVNFLSSGTMFYCHDGNIDYNHQFPLYDLLLTLTYLITGTSLKAALIFEVIFNLFSCITVFSISEKIIRHIGIKIAWLPYAMGITCCLHPFLLYYQVFLVHPLSLDVLMVLLLMKVSFQYLKSPGILNLILLILIAGLTSIERTTLLAGAVPFLILSVSDKSLFAKYVSATGLGILLFTGTWMVRNYYHTGQFQLTSGVFRYLWIGSLEETQGTNYADAHTNYYNFLNASKISLPGHTLSEQSKQYKNAYFERWKNNKLLIFKMFFVKCKTYWWFSSNTGSQYSLSMQPYFLLYKIFHGCLLLFALTGAISIGKRALIWLALPVSMCVIQALFYMEVRHRMPAEFVVWCFAFIGIWYCIIRSFRLTRYIQ